MENQEPDQNSQLQQMLRVEETIKNRIKVIDNLTTDLKKNNEMLSDIFTNDSTYNSHLEKAKEANKVKNMTKAVILKRPEVAQLSKKIKDIKIQLKEMKDGLSDYLQEYQRLSGSNEIEGEDGEVREIVFIAKLVKKSPRK